MFYFDYEKKKSYLLFKILFDIKFFLVISKKKIYLYIYKIYKL